MAGRFILWRGWPTLMSVLILAILAIAPAVAQQDDIATIRIAVLQQIVERPPGLSNLDEAAVLDGILGGRLAIGDNNTTGRFTKQDFTLREVVVPADGDPVAAFKELVAEGIGLVVADLPREALLAVADLPEAKNALIFNAGAADDSLRNADCRANVLHTGPSRAMRADALAQFLAWKRWTKWFLVVGRRDGDRLFAEALRRAAKRFGGKIVAEKAWEYGPDARRTAQAEVPAFSQVSDYDVLIVADEVGEFGEFLAYRTWDPRPVAGTQGLVPTSWHSAHEQWGSVQMQTRFKGMAGRWMTPLDYNVWTAVRSVGEAATRTKSADPGVLGEYIRGESFALGAFKGQKLTYRGWNGQLRQPVLLAAPRAMVSVSPQQGFLHPVSLLDTLGYDRPETGCDLK